MNISRRLTLTTLLIAALAATTSIGATFVLLRAVPAGDDITIQWRVENENGVTAFEIERRSDDVTEYRRLGRITARGSGTTYSFVDETAFLKPQTGKRFTYRVRTVYSNGALYSPEISVLHEVSSVKRSWGMIKELFR